LSAATAIRPFNDANQQPMTDVSGFAKVLDYIEIMNYDIWGAWSDSVGPNSPLNDTCSPAADQQGSAVSAVQAWVSAGFPANQIVLGMASYGHSFLVTENDAFANSGNTSAASATTTAQPSGTTPIALYPSFDKSQQPFGDAWDVDAGPGVDQCGNPTPGGPSGIFNFGGMIAQGILNQNGTAMPGMGFRFDECSQTVRFPSLLR
jgi:chitinase